MTMPYYASAEQIMRDRSELARKGIARGRSVVVTTYRDGVLFVAENPSTALHKVSELYDRLGFAAVGKYNEFEALRRAGITHADVRGYSSDRRDVTGRALANAYAQSLGSIFTDQAKPYEVELCVAEVGRYQAPARTQLYRVTYDGSIVDEPDFVVMGGATEPIVKAMQEHFTAGQSLADALQTTVRALATTDNGAVRELSELEVAVLDQTRPRRAFRRVGKDALAQLLPELPTPTVGGNGNGSGSGNGNGANGNGANGNGGTPAEGQGDTPA